MRLLTQSAFVDEDDRTFFFAGFFLMAGQVLRCQPRMASSLRSRALPTGRCGLQPSASGDLPDMALVIAHAELVSDQTSDPRTAPQRRREAVRLGAFQQQRLEAFELRGVPTAAYGRRGPAWRNPASPSRRYRRSHSLTLCRATFNRLAVSD